MSGSWASRTTVVLAGDRVTVPASGSSSPERILSRVDFPTPLGARMPMRSPGPMVRSTPSRTVSPPKVIWMPFAASLDMSALSAISSQAVTAAGSGGVPGGAGGSCWLGLLELLGALSDGGLAVGGLVLVDHALARRLV